MASSRLTVVLFTSIGMVLLGTGSLVASSMQQSDEAALLSASLEGRVQTVIELLSDGTDPNARDENGTTPLMHASLSGHNEIVQALLDSGADPNATDKDLDTPLGYYASGYGHLGVATLLLQHGADLSAQNANGTTALMFASEGGFTDLVGHLLDCGADPDAKDNNGDTALGMYAAAYGHTDVVKLLLQHGADVTARANHGWTPLLYAAIAGEVSVVTELLDRGADPNEAGDERVTALMMVADGGHMDAVTALLDRGADATVVDSDGISALMYAAVRGHWEIADALVVEGGASMEHDLVSAAENAYTDVVTALLERGVDANARDSDSTTALMAAALSGVVGIVELVLEHGADLEARDVDGITALGYAAQSDFADIVRLLLERGASMATGPEGASALMLAALNGAETVTPLLLDEGANIEATADDGSTALMWAALYGRTASVNSLLDRGANLHAKNNLGVPALTWAAMNGHTDVVELLINCGAEVDSRDSGNDTPLQYAAMNGHLDVVQVLLEHGADPHARNYGGATPIARAQYRGHDAVVELLTSAGPGAELTSAVSEIDAVLISLNDLPPDVEVTAEGPATESDFFPEFSTPARSLRREFGTQNMVFKYGSSSLMNLEVAAGAFASSEEARKSVMFYQLIDFSTLIELGAGIAIGGQMSLGDVRPIDLSDIGDVATGWLMEMVFPFATLDMAYVVFSRGRVTVSLVGMGVNESVQDEDIDELSRMMDERISQDSGMMADQDSPAASVSDSVCVDDDSTVAERADGIALDVIVPSAADIPGSMLSSSRYYQRERYRAYERVFEGRGFTFLLGESQLVSATVHAMLFDSDAEALKEVLQATLERSMSTGDDDEFADIMLLATEIESEVIDAPELGTATSAVYGGMHGALNVDFAMVTFSVGRLAVGVVGLSPPGSLRSEDVIGLAVQVHARLLEQVPDMASRTVDSDVGAAVQQIVSAETEAVEFAEAGRINEALSTLAQVDTANAAVGIGGSTWNTLCWHGSLAGNAAAVLGACDAAVARDSTLVEWRDSRGVARALTGDNEGAIDDLLYVAGHHEDSDRISERQQWVQVLRRGRNPITEDVLAQLRQRTPMN